MKEKTKRKQMSLLDSIVDLILGYSDIDFEKIIQEEREKPTAAETAPAGGSPPPDRKQHCPRRLPDSYRITTRQPPAPAGPPPYRPCRGGLGKGVWG